jgi:hypothetical protein
MNQLERNTAKRSHRHLRSMWHGDGEPTIKFTKCSHRHLRSMQHGDGEPTIKFTKCSHRHLRSMQHGDGEPTIKLPSAHWFLRSMWHRVGWKNLPSAFTGLGNLYQLLHSYEEHASMPSYVFRMKDKVKKDFFSQGAFLIVTWSWSVDFWLIIVTT